MTTPTPPEGRIATEQRGHLLLMQIDRPAKRNGFTPAMYRQLAEAYTPRWPPQTAPLLASQTAPGRTG